METKRNGRATRIWASELAEMKVCEQRVVFNESVGKVLTTRQASQTARGIATHGEMHRQAQDIMRKQRVEAKPWCFVATRVFGKDSDEARSLRAFRDEILRPSVAGRLLTRLYYKWSPGLSTVITKTPWGLQLTRLVLRIAIVGARAMVQSKGGVSK